MIIKPNRVYKTLKKIIKYCFTTLPRRVVSSLLIVLFIIAPITLITRTPKAEAAWWNDSWQYRKAIDLGSAGSDQTDFQVKVLTNSDLSTDITNGKIQADLDDLRFTDVNGGMLPYWIEDSTAASVDAWVKIPTLETSGATVYMYYGNPQAVAYSDGNDVFTFFDDFNDGVIDGSTNYISLTSNPITDFSSPFSVSAWVNMKSLAIGSGSADQTYLELYTDASNKARFAFNPTGVSLEGAVTAGGVEKTNIRISTAVDTNLVMTANTWYHTVFVFNGSTITFYVNGVSNTTSTGAGMSYGSGNYIGAKTTTTGNLSGSIDEVRIYDRALSSDEIKDLYRMGEVKISQ